MLLERPSRRDTILEAIEREQTLLSRLGREQEILGHRTKTKSGATITLVPALWAALLAILLGPPTIAASSPDPSSHGWPVGLVAVCVASDEPVVHSGAGNPHELQQLFQWIETLEGAFPGQFFEAIYGCSTEVIEHPIRRGETVVWAAGPLDDVRWRGLRAWPATLEGRAEALRWAEGRIETLTPDSLSVQVEWRKHSFARGEHIPVAVCLQNASEGENTLWSEIDPDQFNWFAEEGGELASTFAPDSVLPGAAPLRIKPHHVAPCMTGDLQNVIESLPERGVQRFVVTWRGSLRVGTPTPRVVEFVSGPVAVEIREPATLAWGKPVGGLACGLATGSPEVAQGDRVVFDLGFSFNSSGTDSLVDILSVFQLLEKTHFTFTDSSNGESFSRDVDYMSGGKAPLPSSSDFYRLRSNPVTIHSVAVRLLGPKGEQLPAGTYSVVATHENPGRPSIRNIDDDPRYKWPWRFWKGTLTSSLIILRVRQADPREVEVWTSSGLVLFPMGNVLKVTESTASPLRLSLVTRPGYLLVRRIDYFISVGEDDFHQVAGANARIWQQGAVHIPLSPESRRRVAAGESLRVQGVVGIFEKSDATDALGLSLGDGQLLWDGTISSSGH